MLLDTFSFLLCIKTLPPSRRLVRFVKTANGYSRRSLPQNPIRSTCVTLRIFVWRFCVNYIPLNQVTHLVVYPIPHCNAAISNDLGGSYIWLYNAPLGYQQISASKETQEKLAFQGPDGIKWTYNVMPFGLTNSPETFITMIHDLDSVWKQLSKDLGLGIGNNADTVIIVDDIFNWAKTFPQALRYIAYQLLICKAYCLTLSLKKSHFFPKLLEFAGIDILPDGNCPAMLKHELLKH